MRSFEEKEYTAEEKRELIRSFKTSNEGLERFCEQNGISASIFMSWIKRNNRKKKENTGRIPKAIEKSSFVRLPVKTRNAYCSIEPTTYTSSIPITLRTGQWSIELYEGFSESALSQIVKVLEA